MITQLSIYNYTDNMCPLCVQKIIKALRNDENNFIIKNKLSNYVQLYGNKVNPYPYFINADFFVLMSYNEAAPMVIGEWNLLGLPILSTETISAKEMITTNGIVCSNSSIGIFNSIKNLISQKKDSKNIKKIQLCDKTTYKNKLSNIRKI